MGKSDFLFATPGFFTGMGRTIDLSGLLESSSYNFSATPKDADLWAIAQDWNAVGQDLRRAVKEAEAEIAEALEEAA